MLAALAAGCAARPSEIGREPVLSPVGSGIARPAHDPTAELKRGYAAAVAAQPISTGSLWRDRAADLFRDPRARHVGDILTVTISMKDKASLDNKSKRSRDATRGFGLDMSHDIDWSAFVSAGSAKVDTAIKSNTSTDGKGEIARSENIDLRVAAVVTEVLPNGSLLIQGSQEIRVNYELRVLTFTGVVSITDIKADNTIPHDRIAEVRMSYGGRGRSMEVQQPAWGQQIVDLVFPF
ncbi:MAG: flagellar basal body L-ring protein FlgH [Hyphomicrobiaceae bacterium]